MTGNPFIRVADLKKEVHGISQTEVLAQASIGTIKLCVLLGGDARNEKAFFLRLGFDEKLEDFEKMFPDVKSGVLSQLRVFDNGFARVEFNPNPETPISPTASVKGLFELKTKTIVNLVNNNEVTDGDFVTVSPYGGEMFIWLWRDFFGDDPLSKLVIPSAELDKLATEHEGNQQSGDVGSDDTNEQHAHLTEAYEYYKPKVKDFFERGLNKIRGERAELKRMATKELKISSRTEDRYFTRYKEETGIK